MKEVLIDRNQFVVEDFVQVLEHLGVAFHAVCLLEYFGRGALYRTRAERATK